MAEFIAGPTMVLTWSYGAGSVLLAGDYRSCAWNPTQDFVDASAGPDTQHGRLAALKDATASVSVVAQTGGTQIIAALAAGQAGTLYIQPEGTATNKRKITFPAYASGAATEMPYADVVVVTCEFMGAGAVLNNWTDGTN